jgi:outer membrane murein-binding lipoprotein Lpp
MDSRTQERVEQWDSRPFSGGYDGLRDLVASDFSGAVTAAGSWLFLLNGRVVGTVDGDVDDFENSSGTVYEAPHPSLPLLCAMDERGGETRAKYYTNETPLREVDQTLQDGSFTGYVELSENVLSGDYYAVYYGGRRMAAAYVGSSERLLTGEDAFERAADEVGIYEVVDVEIDVTDVPDTDESESSRESETPTATEPTAEPDTQSAADESRSSTAEAEIQPDADSAAQSTGAETESPPEPGERPDEDSSITTTGEADPDRTSAPGITEPADEETASSSGRDEERSSAHATPADASNGGSDDSTRVAVDELAASEAGGGPEDRPQTTSSPDPEAVEEAARELDRQDIDWTEDGGGQDARSSESNEDEHPEVSAAEGDELEQRLEQEEQWRETRRIPSIDPDNTKARESASPTSGSPSRRDAATDAAGEPSARRSAQSDPGVTQSSRQAADRTEQPSGPEAPSEQTSDESQTAPVQRVERLEGQRDELRATVEQLEAERDQLRSKNQELSSTADRLRSRIQDLEDELERARNDDGRGRAGREEGAGARLSRREALSQTNLFVRYASKSQPTLKTAHEGRVDRTEVESNLRLEHHTQFDEADAVVDGEPYEDVLAGSMEYRFVDWLATELFFEIRDTGHADALGELYDAIFQIDRVEFRAAISLADDETEDVPDSVEFDVVAYDKMGCPLLVANLNDSREPASETMLTEMEEAASAVKANYPDLGAAVVVTSSYFEPGALEVVERATGGGFLSRGSQLSYVNLSRKQGYHLCLAESRSEGFHMNVPEL